VVAPAGDPRRRALRPSGQHFLRSDSIAAEIVDQARVDDSQVVFEIGAGTGRITRALARRAGRVVAVEVDPILAHRLRQEFSGNLRVELIEGDVLTAALPDTPFRAMGNLPFGIGTAVLRRLLDDPASFLLRADVILQYEAARKRAQIWPGTLTTLGWLPWLDFRLVRHLSRWAFEPAPPVDAGLLAISRRGTPLLPPERRPAFVRLLGACFRRGPQPVRRALAPHLSARDWARWARDRGVPLGATARDLDVLDWVSIFESIRRPE
jgi:23S rRNA (adenine-N6)-dimethyltransferase